MNMSPLQMNFANLIKLRILRHGEYPGLSGGSNVITKSLEGRRACEALQGEVWRFYTSSFKDGKTGQETRNAVLEVGKDKERNTSWQVLEGMQSCRHLDFRTVKPNLHFSLQSKKRINFYIVFSHKIFGNLLQQH